MKFENKVAIITGSTRGIGRATAELFAKEGAKVIVVGTKEELGESCVNALSSGAGFGCGRKIAIYCWNDLRNRQKVLAFGGVVFAENGLLVIVHR